MPYTEFDGISHYYEVHGPIDGQPVLVLHGGYCSIETWQPLIERLAPTFRVHAPERPGHGRTRDREAPFSYNDMLEDTLAYLDAQGLESAHIVGFSDGAIVGLLLAVGHPERVRSLVSISANLDPDAFVDADESGPAGKEQESVPDPEDEAYARLSPDGPEHQAVVVAKLMTLWTTEPHIDPADLDRIVAPTLVMAGDRDHIRSDHTALIAHSIRDSQLHVVADAGHRALREKPEAVNQVISEFLES
ncbi:alpha/beta hydrolase [soil metagenome]